MKIGLITGNGQDANYLAKLLLEKDYKVICAAYGSEKDLTDYISDYSQDMCMDEVFERLVYDTDIF
jgi:GDP-D-mannose dehydratase